MTATETSDVTVSAEVDNGPGDFESITDEATFTADTGGDDAEPQNITIQHSRFSAGAQGGSRFIAESIRIESQPAFQLTPENSLRIQNSTGSTVTVIPTESVSNVTDIELGSSFYDSDGTINSESSQLRVSGENASGFFSTQLNINISGDTEMFAAGVSSADAPAAPEERSDPFDTYTVTLVANGNIVDSTDERLVGIGYNRGDGLQQNSTRGNIRFTFPRASLNQGINESWTASFELRTETGPVLTKDITEANQGDEFNFTIDTSELDSGEYNVALSLSVDGNPGLNERIIRIFGFHDVTIESDTDEGSGLPGDGSESSPYKISNASELQAMEDDLGANYELVSDIKASNTSEFNGGRGFDPVGGAEFNESTPSPFTGIFDGTNNTITGLTISRPDENNVGLFGVTGSGATVTDVTLANVTVTGEFVVGGLVGENSGNVTDAFAVGPVSGNTDVGGLVGTNFDDSGTTQQSYFDINTTGQDQDTSAGNATGLTTAQMQGQAAESNMSGFEFGVDWQTQTDPADYPVLSSLQQETEPEPPTATASVTFDDQTVQNGSTSVTVGSVTFDRNGSETFNIVVHQATDDNDDGTIQLDEIGKKIGESAELETATSTDISVNISKQVADNDNVSQLTDTQTLVAMLHTTNTTDNNNIVHTAPIRRNGTPVFDQAAITVSREDSAAPGKVSVGDATVNANNSGTVDVTLNQTPEGVQTANITVSLSNETVGEIEDAQGGAISGNLFEIQDSSASSITFRAADLGQNVQNGSGHVTLATVTINGTTAGDTSIDASVNSLGDDQGTQSDQRRTLAHLLSPHRLLITSI